MGSNAPPLDEEEIDLRTLPSLFTVTRAADTGPAYEGASQKVLWSPRMNKRRYGWGEFPLRLASLRATSRLTPLISASLHNSTGSTRSNA